MFWRPLVRSCALLLLLLSALPLAAQSRLTSPTEFFGHEIGADYVLPNYSKFLAYWETLARQSDRMELDTIGKTAEGRPQVMAIVSTRRTFGTKSAIGGSPSGWRAPKGAEGRGHRSREDTITDRHRGQGVRSKPAVTSASDHRSP